MAKYDIYGDKVKTADNFVRTFNRQLTQAYKRLGANSQTYKNLKSLANTYFKTDVKTNKSGIVQVSRGINDLRKYANSHVLSDVQRAMYKTNKYGNPVKKNGKRIVKQFYDTQNAITKARKQIKQAMKSKGIKKPKITKEHIKKQTEINDKIDSLFTMYGKYMETQGMVVDGEQYEDWNDIITEAKNGNLTETELDKLLERAKKYDITAPEKDLTDLYNSGTILEGDDLIKFLNNI